MANYRRWRVEGGTYFFTLVTQSSTIFGFQTARDILGPKLRECAQQWPFETNAIVLLPEHLHLILTLPAGDAHYPRRLGWIKKEFTKEWLAIGGREQQVSHAMLETS